MIQKLYKTPSLSRLYHYEVYFLFKKQQLMHWYWAMPNVKMDFDYTKQNDRCDD